MVFSPSLKSITKEVAKLTIIKLIRIHQDQSLYLKLSTNRPLQSRKLRCKAKKLLLFLIIRRQETMRRSLKSFKTGELGRNLKKIGSLDRILMDLNWEQIIQLYCKAQAIQVAREANWQLIMPLLMEVKAKEETETTKASPSSLISWALCIEGKTL